MYNFDKSTGCYRFRRIQAKNVNITHIKKDKKFDVSPVLKADVKHVGENDGEYLFERESSTSYASLLKVGVYSPKNTNYNDLKRGELVDMIMSYILSEFIVDDRLKFVMLPIMNFDVSYGELMKLNGEIAKRLPKMDRDEMLYVKVLERYHNMITLEEYLKSKFTDDDLKRIIFQVIYALFKIQLRYGNFRHNDLGLNAIYLYTDPSTKKVSVNLKGTQMDVDKITNLVKISNYSNSCISGVVDNTDVNKTEGNPYYDMHFFLNTLYLHLTSIGKLSFGIKNFIMSVIPDNFLTKEGKFNGIDEAYYNAEVVDVQTPMTVLVKNNFFSEFIKNKSMDSSPTMSNSPKSLNSFGIKENSIDYSISTSITHDSDSPLLLAKEIKNRKRLSKYNNKDGSMKKVSSNNQKSVTGNRTLRLPKAPKADRNDDVFRYSETGLTVTEAQFNDSSDSPVRRSKHLLSVSSDDGISETSGGRPNIRTEDLSSTSFEGRANDDDEEPENVDDAPVEPVEEEEEEVLVTSDIDATSDDIEPTETKKKKKTESEKLQRSEKRKKSKKSKKSHGGSPASTSSFSFGNALDSTSDAGSLRASQQQPQVRGNKFMRLFNETAAPQGQMGFNQPGQMNSMNQMYQMIDQHEQQMPQMAMPQADGGNSYFTNSVERTILDRLGNNFEGELPDLYQYNLPMPGEFGSNQGMMQSMNGFNLPAPGMALPQPGFDMGMMNQYGSDMIPQMSQMSANPLPQHLQMNGSMAPMGPMMGGEKKGLFF